MRGRWKGERRERERWGENRGREKQKRKFKRGERVEKRGKK